MWKRCRRRRALPVLRWAGVSPAMPPKASHAIAGPATSRGRTRDRMELRRRTLLKTAALVAAGSVLTGCKPQVHKLVPYLLPDDEIVPGVDVWYASTCQECAA